MGKGRLAIVQKMLEAGGQSPARIADFMQGLSADPALAARLVGAAESGDYRAILKAMSEQQWGRSPAIPAPEAPVPTGSRSPIPFEQRVVSDPEIRRTIEAAGVPPALRAGVDAGDPEAIMAAYRGAESAEDSIRTLRKPPDQVAAEGIASQFDKATYNPRPDNPQARSRALKVARESYPAEYDIAAEDLMNPDLLGGMTPQYRRLLQELEKNDWLGFDHPSQAVSSVLEYGDAPSRWDMTPELLEARDAMIFANAPGRAASARAMAAAPRPARQMELPFTAAQEALPNRPIGPGVAVGIDGPPTDADAYRFADDVLNRPKPGRFATARRAASDFVQGARAKAKDAIGDSDSLRRTAATAAGATAAGTAAYLALKNKRDMRNDAEAAVESGGEADLAAETSPPPAVAATQDVPEPTTARAPADYSFRARFLINRLNDMRRAASPEVLRANGGDVPGAATIKAEIERLIALGNEQRRSTATFVPADKGSEYYKQAQMLIDQVNQLQSQGYPHGSPQVQRLMAQVRQLQSQGDAIRNRRAG